jgi:Protein of unknown function (DUF3306)
MAEDEKAREPLTLKRWSARKLAASQESAGAQPADATPLAAPATAAPPNSGPVPGPAPLPPVESLTFDSDFTAFMKADVDDLLKRAALKKLLHDPRFNVMDGLDVYIDDYSKPDPIEPELVKQLMQARFLFNPPKTRVTEQGFVEDVPPEPEAPPPQALPEAAQPIAVTSENAAGDREVPASPPNGSGADKIK